MYVFFPQTIISRRHKSSFFSVFIAFLFGFLNVFKTTIYCVFVILIFV